jgi:NAD(P)-dependent dehydrogenase (short-subunit alcohol dehydrogenase family)
MVSEEGGIGLAVRTDPAKDEEVSRLAARIDREQGRLDILVLDFWGDELPVPFSKPFREVPLGAGRATIAATLWPHVRTLQALVPLLLRDQTHSRGLVVEVLDGPALDDRSSLFFDLAATLRSRLAHAVAEELAPHGITAVGVSPGCLRSELTLDRFGVPEANWRAADTPTVRMSRWAH